MACRICPPGEPGVCPAPEEDMALTGSRMLIAAGFPGSMTMGAAYRMMRAANFEMNLPTSRMLDSFKFSGGAAFDPDSPNFDDGVPE